MEQSIINEDTPTKPSPQELLWGIVQPLIPKLIWTNLTGKEFTHNPSTIAALLSTGIQMATSSTSDFCEWTPADSTTKSFQDLTIQEQQEALSRGEILSWRGSVPKSIQEEYYGADLPLVKTTSIIHMSPRDMASLLIDSSKVPLYNKMSLGRRDEVVFQEGIDTPATSTTTGSTATEDSFELEGEAKIVRNLTQPPLSKSLMEFVTLMYSRRIRPSDGIPPGIMSKSTSPTLTQQQQQDDDINDDNNNLGYVVLVSRAVSGGQWSSNNNEEQQQDRRIRSEILLGMNVLRSVPGEPNQTEVTAVTHVMSPSVPKLVAGKVGMKGAIDFIRDVRGLCSESEE